MLLNKQKYTKGKATNAELCLKMTEYTQTNGEDDLHLLFVIVIEPKTSFQYNRCYMCASAVYIFVCIFVGAYAKCKPAND